MKNMIQKHSLPLTNNVNLLYLYRPIDHNNKNNNKKKKKRKMSFKSAQIFFRESLGTPLDEKSVICRIYTYPTSFVANQFLSSFFGFSFLSKLDHYCPISWIPIFTRGNFRFFVVYSRFGSEIDSKLFWKEFGDPFGQK